MEICEFRDSRILTIVIFDWVKKLSKLNQNSFYATLYLYSGYSIPGLVQFGQLLDPVKNYYI